MAAFHKGTRRDEKRVRERYTNMETKEKRKEILYFHYKEYHVAIDSPGPTFLPAFWTRVRMHIRASKVKLTACFGWAAERSFGLCRLVGVDADLRRSLRRLPHPLLKSTHKTPKREQQPA